MTPTAGLNPFTEEHLRVANEGLHRCAAGLDLCEKCKRCGLPVEDFENQLRAQQAFFNSMKREFFPHAP